MYHWRRIKNFLKPVSIFCLLILVFSLFYPLTEKDVCAVNSDFKPLGELNIGDKIVDESWVWEYKTGNNYTYKDLFEEDTPTGETKPVIWIVVAKNHYSGNAGSVEKDHVTVISEELIAIHSFDNKIFYEESPVGDNHWGNSGTGTAEKGVRIFLNGSSYAGSEKEKYTLTFYDAMSGNFQSAVLETTLPNYVWDTGASYQTNDKVFLPSKTELGGDSSDTYEIGRDWGYFSGDDTRIIDKGIVNIDYVDNDFISADNNLYYWTRSPGKEREVDVCSVSIETGEFGVLSTYSAYHGNYGVRPALNLSSELMVTSDSNADGYFVISEEPYLGGSAVKDDSGSDSKTVTTVSDKPASSNISDDIKSPKGSRMLPFYILGSVLIVFALSITALRSRPNRVR